MLRGEWAQEPYACAARPVTAMILGTEIVSKVRLYRFKAHSAAIGPFGWLRGVNPWKSLSTLIVSSRILGGVAAPSLDWNDMVAVSSPSISSQSTAGAIDRTCM